VSNLEFIRTKFFKDSYSKLSTQDKKRIKSALKKLAANPHHPFPRGMRVHILSGLKGAPLKAGEPAPPIWEFHASLGLIITFQYGEDSIVLRNCGPHDSVLRRP